MAEPDMYVPLCPRCGDPVTSGCYPADGICAVEDDGGRLGVGRRVLLAWLVWAIQRADYVVRPYDTLADARRWLWQPRQRCGWSSFVDRPASHAVAHAEGKPCACRSVRGDTETRPEGGS